MSNRKQGLFEKISGISHAEYKEYSIKKQPAWVCSKNPAQVRNKYSDRIDEGNTLTEDERMINFRRV